MLNDRWRVKMLDNKEIKKKERRIKKEFQRLNEIYSELPEKKYKIALPLIENAAFMRVTLEDMQKAINLEGEVETYQNGANQYGKKESSTVRSYNNMIKNYNTINKRLEDMIPTEVKESKLASFLNDED